MRAPGISFVSVRMNMRVPPFYTSSISIWMRFMLHWRALMAAFLGQSHRLGSTISHDTFTLIGPSYSFVIGQIFADLDSVCPQAYFGNLKSH